LRSLALEAYSESEEETVRFGERLGAALRSRAVVGLTGPLGAGKTRLVQGIARGAGYTGRVRSPTFALLHVYRGRQSVRHIDLYRLDRLDPATEGEWEEVMEEEGLSLVEWADRIPGLLPHEAVWVDLQPLGEQIRRIRLRLPLEVPLLDVWRLR
jgi:tRNA threonylcarbamoyladenosine biosynthesis protein TsaE